MEITNFNLGKHFHENFFDKIKPCYSYIFLLWNIFKDALKIGTSSKPVIQVYCLLYFCFFSKFSHPYY